MSTYQHLQDILDDAYSQAANGKGKERHASDGQAWIDQPIMTEQRAHGTNHFAVRLPQCRAMNFYWIFERDFMWRWDQGRLQYFSLDRIRRIAACIYELDGIPLNTDPDPLLPSIVGLPFAPEDYRGNLSDFESEQHAKETYYQVKSQFVNV